MPLQEVGANDQCQLQAIADNVAKSRKIIIISGAGISTSCGIPDFRSKDGLYSISPEQDLPLTPPPSNPNTPRKRKRSATLDEDLQSSQESTCSVNSRRSSNPTTKLKGQDLFHSRVFQSAESTAIFYKFIAALRQKIQDEVKDTSLTHKFIRTLRDGGRLVRCYTQNIDGLEKREGLCMDLSRGVGNKRRFMKKYYQTNRPECIKDTDFDTGCEVVQLHGDLDRLRCNVCSAQHEWIEEDTCIYEEGAAPACPDCQAKSEKRQSTGKRGLSTGVLRPNVVLYGEEHPANSQLTPFIPHDANLQPDMLIIMGTSLKVFGLQKIIREFSKAIHSCSSNKGRVIFVNRTRPAESIWEGIIDDYIAMDCDTWVEDLKTRKSDIWLRQGEVKLKLTKPGVKRRKMTEPTQDVSQKKAAKKTKSPIEIVADHSIMSNEFTLIATPPRIQARKVGKGNKISAATKATFIPYEITRPDPSPLTNSFKPLDGNENSQMAIPGSPWTPDFSPITPKVLQSNRNLAQIYINLDEDPPNSPTRLRNPRQNDDITEISMQEYENRSRPSWTDRKEDMFINDKRVLYHQHSQDVNSRREYYHQLAEEGPGPNPNPKSKTSKFYRKLTEMIGRVDRFGYGKENVILPTYTFVDSGWSSPREDNRIPGRNVIELE